MAKRFFKKDPSKDPKFNLEKKYQIFLKRIGLSESKMNPVQREQIKFVYFATYGEALIVLRDDVGELEEEQAIKTMQSLLNQVGDFLQKTKNQHN